MFALLTAATLVSMPQSIEEVIKVGSGSYTTKLPTGAKEPAETPWVTADVKGPIPTNDWWSSLVFSKFSNQMFPHPLGIQAHDAGLRIYYPGVGYTANDQGVFTAVMGMPNDLTIGSSHQSTFPDARASHWSDWFVTAAFGNDLKLTFGHGSPFVFGTIVGGGATFSFGKPPKISGTGSVLSVNVDGRTYGLFGPKGSSWEGLGTQKFTLKSDKPYFSVALLPDDKPETLAFFARYAHNHVTDSKVTWAYDEKSSKVTTRYAFSVKAFEPGAEGTVFGLFPHQYQRSRDSLTSFTYVCARGLMKVGTGTGFTTVTPFQGVLPALPNIGSHDKGILKKFLNADAATYKPEIADTYWCGKAMGKLSTLASIADVSGDLNARDQFRIRLKGLLESYFTAKDSNGVFYYNKQWGTLIGYPASYGSDESLNDHHFHYGYFIRAAAEIARLEPGWAKDQKWGGMVNMLIRDCANPRRDDPMFPFLRNFDIYEGHTWAAGKAEFADGNNNESSSEAMNAWTGMIIWGALTGDRQIRDTGIYLYVTEKDAIDNYWFNATNIYPKTFTRSIASMIWGAKAAYATWFSGDPICMHGINYLPMQSGSLYLGTNPPAVQRDYDGLVKERSDGLLKDPKRDKTKPLLVGKHWGGWGDVVMMYQALANPTAALADCDFDKQEMEAGNSRANLYQWIHFLNRVGQVDARVTADTPMYAVFKRSNMRAYVVYKRTYVVYNLGPGRLTVRFSDGKVVVAARPGFTVVE